MDLVQVKSKLKSYKREDIIFNEPHFTERMVLRDGNKEDIIKTLISSERLVYAEKEEVNKYILYFSVSNTRTMILLVIFDKDGKKCLYILTYIMRYRNWRSMVR